MPVVTPLDLEKIFHIDIGNDNDPAALATIARAQDAVEGVLARKIEAHEVVDTFRGAFRQLLLSEWPVISITAVVENGVTLTTLTDYRHDEIGLLYRYSGSQLRTWDPAPGDVVVTYQAGWAAAAVAYKALAGVVLRVAARSWESAVAYAVRPDGTDAIRQEGIGSYSATYAAEVEGGKVSDAGVLTVEDLDVIRAWVA